MQKTADRSARTTSYLLGLPPMRCGDAVSIEAGPHAGLAGHVREITIKAATRAEWLLIELQDGTWVQAARCDVQHASHE